MLDRMFDRGSLPALEALVHFSTARHQAIANNLANVETVGYRAMDVSEERFEEALARAFERQRQSPVGTFELEGGFRFPLVESKDSGILRHLENNVDLDLELGKMVKNAGLHNLAASLLSHQFTMLRTAISERVIG
jgi:flagellar basal-body rod protein FlgB